MNTVDDNSNESAGHLALHVAICATFVAEPVEEPLQCWLREMGVTAAISFAPYNQVFQQLLDPSSLQAKNQNGVNVALVRLEDWCGKPGVAPTDHLPVPDPHEELKRNVIDFLAGVVELRKRNAAPLIVILCPPSPSISASIRESVSLAELEELLASELSRMSAVEIVTSAAHLSLYPLADYHDPHGSRLADIPYATPFYTSLSMMIARKLHKLKLPQRKVIVLDCDNTLWNGVVGEDGCEGISFDPFRKILQECVLAQQRRGMLVALCSKNDEREVLQVFDARSEMRLKKRDLVAWRINWRSKSENLASLSQELGLSLDSFIFIDDDSIVCAEIRASLPEVLTLLLPPVPSEIPTFLRHVWVFDHESLTHEDRQRTKLYQEHFMREQVRRDSTSLDAFLANLELEVAISKMADPEVERVAELTIRTNQFNTTTQRRTLLEMKQLQGSASTDCLVVHVKDRFGDYGLVGAILCQAGNDGLIVDSFLLSCRALGRGVEHRVIAHLGLLAQQRGLKSVNIMCKPSPKNIPAVVFLKGLPGVVCTSFSDRQMCQLVAAAAASVTYSPTEHSNIDNGRVEESGDAGSRRSDQAEMAALNTFLATIAESLRDVPSIHDRFAQTRMRHSAVPIAIPPRTPVETAVAAIFCDLLGLDEISVHDSFFNLGGHSLIAMQVLSRLNAEFDAELTPTLLFTSSFTVTELADTLVQQQLKKMSSDDINQIFQKLSELTDEQAENLTLSGVSETLPSARK
jgi:FkbH-like protein